MNNTNKKIAVIVLACDVGGYDKMVSACKDTWGKIKDVDGVDVYYIYGHRDGYDKKETYCINDDIYSDTPEELNHNIFNKTVNAFEYLLKNKDYDYFFRCTAGSYINLELLKKSVCDIQEDNVYRAVCGYANNIQFGSGSGFLLSKNLAENIVENKNNINHVIMDDVTIGDYLINKLQIPLMDQKRIDCSNNNELVQKFDPEAFHYYFRHTINPDLIYKTHELFNKL